MTARGVALLLAALVALPSLAGAGAPSSEGETVTMRSRLTGVICTGICNEYDVTVRADGLVEYHGWRINHRSPKRLRFRLSPDEHAHFLQLLRPIRPVGLRGPVGECGGEMQIPGRIGLDIRWRGHGPDGRLLLCYDPEAWSRAVEAFQVLRINTSWGYHWVHDEGEAIEAHLRDRPRER